MNESRQDDHATTFVVCREEFMEIARKIRVALTPRSWLLRTKLPNGVTVYGRNRAGYGGRGIYVFRDFIEPEFQQLEKFLAPGGVFVDIGANTGVYTLKAAKCLGSSGAVLAVEPSPDILATLYRSVQENGFSNVRLRNLCVGSQTGVRTLWMNSAKPNSFSLVIKADGARGMSVLTVSLDDLFGWEELDRLDYLKIDAEGAEQEILSGAMNTIKSCRPIVQAEVSMKRLSTELPGYSVFQAPGSANMIHIPDEHEKIHLPQEMGWSKIERQA